MTERTSPIGMRITTPSTASDPLQLVADLKSRINPVYANQIGTESYERRLCAEAIELLLVQRDEPCLWVCDSGGAWETGCDNMFVLNEGGPHDNDMKYCCYCGRPLIEEQA